MTAARFLIRPAQAVAEGDTLLVLGEDGRPREASMRVDSVESGPNGTVRLRLGDEGMSSNSFEPIAKLLILRGADLREVQDTPLLPLQEGHLREAGLGDREIARMNALGGYRQATGDAAFMGEIQDTMDAFLAERHVAVRNAMRSFGWEGERRAVLTKRADSGEAMQLSVSVVKTAGSANLLAMSYVVSPVSRFVTPGLGVFDDLSKSPTTLALQAHTLACDYIRLNEVTPYILDRFGHLLREMGAPVVRGADFAKAIEASIGESSLDYGAKMALSLPVEFRVSPAEIAVVFDANDASVFQVGPGGILENQVIEVPRSAEDAQSGFVPSM